MKKKELIILVVSFILLVVFVKVNVALVHKYLEDEKIKEDSTHRVIGNIAEKEYVWVTPSIEYSLFLNHDVKALKKFAEEAGVTVSIAGPRQFDVLGQIEALEEVIARKPAGIMVIGTERALVPAVDLAVEAGIPVITVDADLVESKRLAFVGSNWFSIGIKQGEAMVRLIGGKGKVALMGIGGADNMEQGFEGFKSVMKDYPDIYIIGEYDDEASVEEARRITKKILNEHSDIAGIAGFDSCSGPGIGMAIKEAGLVGKVKVTSVDIEPEHLRLVKEGVIQKLVGQKRELFTYYGMRLLYDINHSTITLTHDDEKNDIIPIPYIIDTGLIEVDKTNVNSIQGYFN